MEMSFIGEITELYIKFCSCWAISGLIVSGVSLILSVAAGLSGIVSELLVEYAFSLIPPPFDLFVVWSLNPVTVLIQAVLALVLFVWLESR